MTGTLHRAGVAGARASAGLVLLHGRGGSAADILSLVDHAGLPDIAAIAPEAPGRSWWPTSFLAPSAQMDPYVAAGIAAARAAVDTLAAEGLARDRIWIGGFSQGACLALEFVARDGAGLAGVLAFSGGLVGTADAGPAAPALFGHRDKDFVYATPLVGTRAWISVHEADPHIPFTRASDSAAVLRGLGAEATFHAHPGAGHAVMRADHAALRSFLNTA